ncbi:armadillo-type protein [Cubamyces lactineus]|nr:armadillo-type protein [Cubamyces lactineus]
MDELLTKSLTPSSKHTQTRPPPTDDKCHPVRLHLSSMDNKAVFALLPSALATARIIEDIDSIKYPEGIKSPKPELNVNAKQGKFRYDRDFLLQFMAVCREKPDSLPPLDAIGLEPVDQSFAMTRGGSHGHGRRSSSVAMPPPSSTTARQASVGLGISGFSKPNVNPFTMGLFSTPKSSEERFAASNRSTSMSGTAGMPFGRPSPMVRSSSQGRPGGSGGTRSQRGNTRDKERPGAGPSGEGGSPLANSMSLEPSSPLQVSENRWAPASPVTKGQPVEHYPSDTVDREVRTLLDKLTMERFDPISDQIIAWANKSEKEQDGRTLIQVIRLVFEKATDEATWSEMYARLCRKMMEQISPNVRDDGIKNAEGKPISGDQLFRKLLLNRCQEDFERGWVAKEAAGVLAGGAKAGRDGGGGAALYPGRYYAAQKAKRQGLSLIKFIGELFKLQMLTERIMHECVKKLLGNVENPEEEEIESLCKLLTTVGQLLDTPKARAHMDVYFSRMKELTKSGNVNSRMQFMLLDVIELRERKWIPRNQSAAPTTIAALREQIEKEKIAEEKDAMNRTLSMSRGGSRRGADRGEQQIGPGGWAVAGGGATRPAKAGDLSQFGKIAKPTPMTFDSSSVFQKDKSKSMESTLSRQGSSNMFSMLSAIPEIAVEVTSAKSTRPPSMKSSIDFGPGGAPEAPPQPKPQQFLPWSVPPEDKAGSTPVVRTAGSDDEQDEATSGATISVEDSESKTRMEKCLKEFYSFREPNEAHRWFRKLPAAHRDPLIEKLITKAVESKRADA